MQINIREVLFWHFVHGLREFDIALNFGVSIDEVEAKLEAGRSKYPRLIEKFIRWSEIPKPSVEKNPAVLTESHREINSQKSFKERLADWQLTPARIRRCNEKFKIGIPERRTIREYSKIGNEKTEALIKIREDNFPMYLYGKPKRKKH